MKSTLMNDVAKTTAIDQIMQWFCDHRDHFLSLTLWGEGVLKLGHFTIKLAEDTTADLQTLFVQISAFTILDKENYNDSITHIKL